VKTYLLNEPLCAPPKAGVLRNIWNAFLAFDEALDFDPVEDLRRRVSELENRLDRDDVSPTPLENIRRSAT